MKKEEWRTFDHFRKDTKHEIFELMHVVSAFNVQNHYFQFLQKGDILISLGPVKNDSGMIYVYSSKQQSVFCIYCSRFLNINSYRNMFVLNKEIARLIP